MRKHPLLPCEEEGRLGDTVLRENFLKRVIIYDRWRRMIARGLTISSLIEFHTDHKFLILSHNQSAYRRMGRLVAEINKHTLRTSADRYAMELMSVLKQPATQKQHINVLQHSLGFISKRLAVDVRVQIVATIEAYRQGTVSLADSISLFNHHLHHSNYLQRQHYFNPYPSQVMLRKGT